MSDKALKNLPTHVKIGGTTYRVVQSNTLTPQSKIVSTSSETAGKDNQVTSPDIDAKGDKAKSVGNPQHSGLKHPSSSSQKNDSPAKRIRVEKDGVDTTEFEDSQIDISSNEEDEGLEDELDDLTAVESGESFTESFSVTKDRISVADPETGVDKDTSVDNLVNVNNLSVSVEKCSDENPESYVAMGKDLKVKRSRDLNIMQFYCLKCYETFKTLQDFKRHEMIHSMHEFKCEHCSQTFHTDVKCQKHLKSHLLGNGYECALCDKVFDVALTLRTHIRGHCGEPPHICEYCEDVFTEHSTLNVHRQLHEREMTSTYIKCTDCLKMFPTEDEMKAHAVVHLTDRRWVCEECGNAYRRKDALEKHMLNHKGVRSNVCNLCGKSFVLADSLTKHMKSHSSNKSYKCEFCPQGFLSAMTLRTHMTPLECRICHNALKARCLLRSHMITHNGSHNVNICPHCMRNFVTPARLDVHLKKSAEGEGIHHLCRLCKMLFQTKCMLRRHMNTLHSRSERHTCAICKLYLGNERKYVTHMKLHGEQGDMTENDDGDVYTKAVSYDDGQDDEDVNDDLGDNEDDYNSED